MTLLLCKVQIEDDEHTEEKYIANCEFKNGDFYTSVTNHTVEESNGSGSYILAREKEIKVKDAYCTSDGGCKVIVLSFIVQESYYY